MQNYICKNENAVYYECGYSCDNVIYLTLGSQSFFITDGRYVQEAKEALTQTQVVPSANLLKTARGLLLKYKIKSLVFDPRQWSVQEFDALKSLPLYLKPRPGFSQKKRMIKTDTEIGNLQEAVRLGAEGFARFASEVRAGMDEYQLNFLAKKHMSFTGRYELSFDPITAVGENGSKPHALPGQKRLDAGDVFLMDAGLRYKGYCSDRTRTALFDNNLDFAKRRNDFSPQVQKAYDTVLKAHDRAIEGARSGMLAREVDKLARDVIEKNGFGKYFVHSTGHGVGLDIHEMPFIATKSKTPVEDGMVFTVEPGIYLPGEFGIRIEDMVVMEKGRAKIL
ncbi:MAG: M24 family metallopeptidase [Campylobacterota bacterium]